MARPDPHLDPDPDPRPAPDPDRRPDRDAVELSGVEARKSRQRRLIALAEGRESVVSLEDLRRLGFTEDEIRGRVETGELIPRYRGVFSYNRQRLSGRGELHAALLAFGPDAYLSHRSAAAAYGLRPVNPRAIHLTIPGAARRSRENLIVHRTTIAHPHDFRVYDGLRVTSVPRMLIDLAADERADELRRLITEAARRDLLHLDRLGDALTRHHGRPGVPRLAKLLGDYVWTPSDKSTLERDFAAFLAAEPLIPPPDRNVILEGRYEIDFFWATERLAVELDGRLYHQAVKDRERDNAKDIWLQQRGIRVMRIRDFRFEHDRAGIRRDLQGFLAAARAA